MKELIEKAILEYQSAKINLFVPQLSNPVITAQVNAKFAIELIDQFINVLEILKDHENKTNG